ncbi:MAG: YihA family ribosome biogenesis GTP-binding protein [Chlamydiales bacterium]|nr:YihA family ribosome biogenesis GTP-binding protein [Chlamydiales bacterium]
MKIDFKKVELRYVVGNITQLAKANRQSLQEIAIIGKSNVGKSSLVNHLLSNKQLAKTSSLPGKTQTINFFAVDEKFFLVDLPGYGFAKTPEEEQKRWHELIEYYFSSDRPIKCVLVLLDSRRDTISDLDKMAIEWIKKNQINIIVIFTKTDKLSESELKSVLNEKKTELSNFLNHGPSTIAYSIKNSDGKDRLIKEIQGLL